MNRIRTAWRGVYALGWALGWLLGWVMLSAPGLAHAQSEAAALPGTVVITAAEIEAAGLSRLTDLFGLLDTWHTTTIDGYTHDASANGLAPLEGGGWRVLVDGRPLDLTSLGTQDLNLVPLHVLQLDSVTVVNTPMMVAGFFASGGVMHLHTRRPAPGLTVRAGIAAGNEINDPGPYRYTGFATPNIDRIGPTYLGEMTFAGKGGSIRAGVKIDQHHPTDERIFDRVRARYVGFRKQRVLVFAPHLTAETYGRAGRHRLFAGYSQTKDLRFFTALGSELPLTQDWMHASLAGDTAPGGPAGLRYHLAAERLDLGPRPNRDTLDLDWQEDRFRGNLEARLGTDRAGMAVGGTLTYRARRTAYPLTDPRRVVPRLYAHVDAQLSPAWRQSAGVDLTYLRPANGLTARLGVKALTATMIRPHPAHALRLSAAYAWEAPEEGASRWQDQADGYGFFDDHGEPTGLPPFFVASRSFFADLAWDAAPHPALTFTLTGGVRRFQGLTLASRSYQFLPDSPELPAVTTVFIGREGQVWTASARVRAHLHPTVRQEVGYAFTRPVSGDDVVFWEAWASQPWHRASYTVTFAPNARFSVWTKVQFQSATQWPAFAALGAATSYRIPDRRPGLVTVDVTAQKRLWGDRLRASLSLRNLTNAPVRTHPAGDITQLVFFINLEARFNVGD